MLPSRSLGGWICESELTLICCCWLRGASRLISGRMVNNAGIAIEGYSPAPIHETADDTFDKTIRVNARSVFLGCKYATAQMLKQEAHPSGDRGWIINTASILGLIGFPGCASYSAAKGAVVQLTRQVAIDYAAHRIHCNAICPGCKLHP